MTTTMNSENILTSTLNDSDLVKRIKASNILLVGAGGIGCEVLKGLILNGFPRITIIDLDTIDVSNLNRQFLYNKKHVGKSKAMVAAEIAIERFGHVDPETKLPISTIIPIHDSILNLKYDKEFYQQFTFVINALDNNATRVHVNRLCLSANRPLIESGSAGYFGNVTLIKRGVTKCFECIPPKKDENTYASCTIRNTPSLPIHCIVWAKHLFAQLFGQCDEDISPDATVINNDDNNGNNDDQSITSNNDGIKQTTREYVESIDYDAKLLFEKIFHHDICYLKGMKNLWKNRKNRREPRELSYEQILNGNIQFDNQQNSQNSQSIALELNGNGEKNSQSSTSSSSKIINDQRLWTMKECLSIFIDSIAILKQRLKNEPNNCIEWDKDDDVAVDFVTSVSNFRCHCFYIQRNSKFDVKSMAGNIIPAISTTNAIVGGGYILLQSLRLLKSLLPQRIFENDRESKWKPSKDELTEESQSIMANCFTVFISNKNQLNLSKIAIEELLPPNSNCLACSGIVKEFTVELPFNRITLADLIEQLIMKKFKTVAPDINCYDLKKMIYAADDEDELKSPDSIYRDRTIDKIDYIYDNIQLNIKDLEQDFEVNIRLKNVKFTLDDEEQLNGDLFRIVTDSDDENLERINNDKQSIEIDNLAEIDNVKDTKAVNNNNNKEQDRMVNLKRKSLSQSEQDEANGKMVIHHIDVDDDDEIECLTIESSSKRLRTN